MVEISSFWHTPQGSKGISVIELLSIKSFCDNGYKFVLYTYEADSAIYHKIASELENFEVRDANMIVPFSEYFSDDRGAGVAAFSDYFRYHLCHFGVPAMNEGGGIYRFDAYHSCLGRFGYGESASRL